MSVLAEQAELYGQACSAKLPILTVHSMLHLAKYDHESSGLKQYVCAKEEVF